MYRDNTFPMFLLTVCSMFTRDDQPPQDPATGPDRPQDAPPDGLGDDGPPLPERPCAARPGSEERMVTLETRYADGVALWHPEDYAYRRGA